MKYLDFDLSDAIQGGNNNAEGLCFLSETRLEIRKKYIVWLFLLQIVTAITPIAAALLPKMVIDELTGMQRMNFLILYVLVFAGWICLIEYGTHDELLAKQAQYAELYEMQAQYYT